MVILQNWAPKEKKKEEVFNVHLIEVQVHFILNATKIKIMEWNKETVLYFLNLIRERPIIWDAQCRDYKDKIKRNIAIEEIALLMGCTVKTVNTKWTSLKNQYSREKRNMTGIRTGSGANDIFTTKWYGFKEMESLMDGNKPEQTYDNLSESSSSLPLPQPQSTLTPPLFQPLSTTNPPMLRPNTPTPPPLRPSNTPTPTLLRLPNTTGPPPFLHRNNTPTPPLDSPPIPPASTKKGVRYPSRKVATGEKRVSGIISGHFAVNVRQI